MKKFFMDTKTWIWIARIFLTLSCIVMIGWIFSNSLKDASESSSQSAGVTEFVQEAVETIAPDLVIAETEEETFEILHGWVRTAGHFCEFALLCALLSWCVGSYTLKKPWFLIPVPFCVGVAFLDEYIQTFSDGRAGEFKDILVDSLGALAGFAFAVFVIFAVVFLYRIWKNKRAQTPEKIL